MRNVVSLVCFCGILLTALAAASEAQQYRVVVLGTGFLAEGINNNGEIAGSDLNTGQACVWQNGQITELGPGGAMGINDFGEVVGADDNSVLCVWQGGVTTELSLPSSVKGNGCASAINDAGSIVGIGGWQDPSGAYKEQALLWQNGQTICIGSLGTSQVGLMMAYGINNSGTVVGSDGNTGYSFIWQNGVMTDLTAIPGSVYGINDSGQMVGSTGGIGNSACLYLSNGQPMYLPMPSVPYSQYVSWAEGINDNGWIVGDVGVSENNYTAILWIPVPEPSSIVALLCGIGGMSGMIWRRKSA